MNKEERVQVHRFHDCVAVSLGGVTVYLPESLARALANSISLCADDIAYYQWPTSNFTVREHTTQGASFTDDWS